jgi:hypothetical protein
MVLPRHWDALRQLRLFLERAERGFRGISFY